MKKSTLITTTLLTMVAGVACAQDATHSITVRGGYSYLANKDSRDATSTGGFTAGLSYDLPSMAKSMGSGGGKVSLDVDYDSHSGNSNKITSFAAQIAMRTSTGTKMKGGSAPYFGLGIGYFQNHYDILGVTGTKGVLGGSVMVGMNFSEQAGIEVSYRASGSVDGVKFDTINAAVTVHF